MSVEPRGSGTRHWPPLFESDSNPKAWIHPLVHTLVGACLAEAGLKRRSRLALPALLLGANLPDVDALAMLASRDCMYDFRRGVTHGLVGILVGPWLLLGVLWIGDRWFGKRRHFSEPPQFWQLLSITYLAVLTHPFLDWLNNYGVRLLSPLSERWFYGDALFIIDPWLCLALGAAAVLAWSRSEPSIATWLVLGLSTTGLVLWAPMVPLTAKVLWCLLLAAILLALQSQRLARRSSQAARAALVLLGGYVVAMLGLTAIARSQGGYRVWIRDVRYSRTPTDIGRVRVDLDAELRPLAVSFNAAARQSD